MLEHPANSYAWDKEYFGLAKPVRGKWTRAWAPFSHYWVTEVSQSAYGHKARKNTWLLYCGDTAPPALDWWLTKESDVACLAMYERHYSCYRYADGRQSSAVRRPWREGCTANEHPQMLCGCGAALLTTAASKGLIAPCSVTESGHQSSSLIRQADKIADCLWPDSRHYTYVDPARVASKNPGFCFIAAGWRKCGRTKGGLLIMERKWRCFAQDHPYAGTEPQECDYPNCGCDICPHGKPYYEMCLECANSTLQNEVAK